ncbi:hypothetical protein IHE44_0001437 [Lamprotornis superbus]|uniref:Uncharacterized protein n=1 Tax=Lamprotornis superbus TaxID=245042 RepID=A0A835NH82_9PASS|nr:hypothetical protein IHE44_0001437 [Lamprotornis superbus]
MTSLCKRKTSIHGLCCCLLLLVVFSKYLQLALERPRAACHRCHPALGISSKGLTVRRTGSRSFSVFQDPFSLSPSLSRSLDAAGGAEAGGAAGAGPDRRTGSRSSPRSSLLSSARRHELATAQEETETTQSCSTSSLQEFKQTALTLAAV